MGYPIFTFLLESHPHSDKYDIDIKWIRNETDHGVWFIFNNKEYTSYIKGIGDIPERKDFYEMAAIHEVEDIIEDRLFAEAELERNPDAIILFDA